MSDEFESMRAAARADEYLATINRIEPDIHPIDAAAGWASIAVSLRRMADALTGMAHPMLAMHQFTLGEKSINELRESFAKEPPQHLQQLEALDVTPRWLPKRAGPTGAAYSLRDVVNMVGGRAEANETKDMIRLEIVALPNVTLEDPVVMTIALNDPGFDHKSYVMTLDEAETLKGVMRAVARLPRVKELIVAHMTADIDADHKDVEVDVDSLIASVDQ